MAKVTVIEVDRSYGTWGREVRTTREYQTANFEIKDTTLIVRYGDTPVQMAIYPKGMWLHAHYEG